jgi:hypothetical protein
MRAAKFEDKMDGREECKILTECWREKKKKTMEERERNTIRKTGLRVKKCEKIKSKRKMDECRAE